MKFLEKVSEAIIRTSYSLAAILLAAAVLLVFYQVVTRFVLGHSAVWSELAARALIVWGVFLVFGPAIRTGRMIPIDVIQSMLPAGVQIWLARLVSFAILMTLAILIWFGWKLTMRVTGQELPVLPFSMAWLYAAVPVGSLLAIPGLFLAHIDAETGRANSGELVG